MNLETNDIKDSFVVALKFINMYGYIKYKYVQIYSSHKSLL